MKVVGTNNVYYGIEGDYVNVSYLCHKSLKNEDNIIIPSDDNLRAHIFGDHLFGILKHIKVGNTVYPANEQIILNASDITFNQKEERKSWWNTKGVNIDSPDERLRGIHRYLSLDFGNINEELPEQLMAIKFIKEDDIVLEIGGNIGRNSCVIATVLADDSNLVVLECNDIHAKELIQNRDNNNFTFHVENSALSKVPLIQKGWDTFLLDSSNTETETETIPEGYTEVNTITWTEINQKYNLSFNVIVADCEGALYQILKDEPSLLDNIHTVILENDFIDLEHKRYVDERFTEAGLTLVYNRSLTPDIYNARFKCHSCFFQVFTKKL
jgi:FkbM family methyltransferase